MNWGLHCNLNIRRCSILSCNGNLMHSIVWDIWCIGNELCICNCIVIVSRPSAVHFGFGIKIHHNLTKQCKTCWVDKIQDFISICFCVYVCFDYIREILIVVIVLHSSLSRKKTLRTIKESIILCQSTESCS